MKRIIIIIMMLMLSLVVIATDDYNNVQLAYPADSTPDDYNNINLVLGEAAAPGDTCTYTSGDWIVDCSDNCTISTNTDLSSNTLYIYGDGTFFIDANITIDKLIKENNGCLLINKLGDNKILEIKAG